MENARLKVEKKALSGGVVEYHSRDREGSQYQ